MYKQFYGLRDIPFSLAPDPRYLFRTESLLEVFANLQYGIENGKGIVVVTGEVGTGKTTVLRSMLQSLDRSVLAAYIFNPLLSTTEFFDLLAGEFRMRSQSSKASMLRLLGNVLMSRHAQGHRTILVVDEAHLLPHHLLEEIRLLSNFETNREKLLQVILCGQPELHDLLGQPELRQLKQRVSLRCSIKTLTPHETGEYIRWRLRIAGCTNENLFERDAIKTVHRFTGGIPRIINNICDNALLTGFSEGSQYITAAIVNDVVEVLDINSIEIGSAKTVADAVIQRDVPQQRRDAREQSDFADRSKEQAASRKVSYIRRDVDPAARSQKAVSAGNGKYVIRSESESDSETPLTFFSRVRVSKSS
jgi:general secretion pathway protein A